MSKLYCDVVNVSEGFQLRTAYKKKVKPSKVDGLLERRVKLFTLEEKQRLERMRQAALLAKMAPAKTTVKLEGNSKQLPAVTPTVKEEKEERLRVKDDVVNKLDFEQEQPERKADNLEVKTDATVVKPMEVSDVQGNSGESHKEVNGRSPTSVEVSSKHNCITGTIENEVGQGENTKKRGYEEMVEAVGEGDKESMEQSKNNPVQVNGSITDNTRTNSNSDQDNQVQEPVKSLMNGNVLQNISDICHPPPLKVPKLENHMAEKAEAVEKNESTAMSSEASSPNSNTDNGSTTTSEEQSDRTANSTVIVAIKGSPKAAIPQKTIAPTTDSKTDLTVNSSMMISKEYSTKGRVSLLKFSKFKKARSGTALPSYRKFVTKSSKKSIFILPNDDLKRLARRASNREVPIFNYSAKPAPDIWPYPSPRPTFGITWRLVQIF